MNPADENKQPAADVGNEAAQANETVENAAAPAADTAELEKALAEAQAKANENWERCLRLQADMENQRRRFEKQVEDAHKYSVQRFAEGLLPVMDSLEMGMQAEGDIQSIREGMGLTLKQFEAVMEKFNLEQINPLGQPFNPEQHQAVGMQPHPDYDNNTVSLVMQKGYSLNGRTIRPAMVMVSKK